MVIWKLEYKIHIVLRLLASLFSLLKGISIMLIFPFMALMLIINPKDLPVNQIILGITIFILMEPLMIRFGIRYFRIGLSMMLGYNGVYHFNDCSLYNPKLDRFQVITLMNGTYKKYGKIDRINWLDVTNLSKTIKHPLIF